MNPECPAGHEFELGPGDILGPPRDLKLGSDVVQGMDVPPQTRAVRRLKMQTPTRPEQVLFSKEFNAKLELNISHLYSEGKSLTCDQ